jgi:alkyl hydroperoxide reductase subunit AhpC
MHKATRPEPVATATLLDAQGNVQTWVTLPASLARRTAELWRVLHGPERVRLQGSVTHYSPSHL